MHAQSDAEAATEAELIFPCLSEVPSVGVLGHEYEQNHYGSLLGNLLLGFTSCGCTHVSHQDQAQSELEWLFSQSQCQSCCSSNPRLG